MDLAFSREVNRKGQRNHAILAQVSILDIDVTKSHDRDKSHDCKMTANATGQSELPRPIKIGLGCVYGVELCTK